MRSTFLLLCLSSLLWSSLAQAGLPEAGKVYAGPKSFSSSQDGLAFTLPKGWSGIVEGEYFGIIDPKDKGQNGLVLLWVTKGSLQDAREAMASNIPIGASILKPKSKITTRKNVLSANYSVLRGELLTEATITTRVAHGTIVAIIAAYSPRGKKAVLELNKALLGSLRVTKPKTATVASTASSDTWQKWLTGARLTRFSNGSGYAEKESYTFCPNGSFYRSFNASSASVNGTGAAAANNSGSWSATGSGNEGVIILKFANDTVDRTAVKYHDGKTYWGGTRYFYEANKCN